MSKLSAIILAAGEGKRMKSKYSKVLHKLSGKPMIEYVYDAVKETGIDDCIVIVGHKAEEVKNFMGDKAKYAFQEKQLGTGHAVAQAEGITDSIEGYTVVLCGDTPLVTSETIKRAIKYHKDNDYVATVITAVLDDATGYGRIIRDENENVLKIVEHKDANDIEKKVKEVNSGLYCFTTKKLFEALKKISNNNSQGEYYLTDTLEILIEKGEKIGAIVVSDNNEILGVNSRAQLAEAQRIIFKRALNKHMTNGVSIADVSSTYISMDAIIGRDTIIYPGTVIEGKTEIGEDCIIGPNTRITESKIGNGVTIQDSVIKESRISENANIGPFAYLRPNSNIGSGVKIGDFVEIKNSTIGNDTKVAHLAYIGDADIGSGCNLGCGTIVVNYDGIQKHRSLIEDNVFVGCNSNIVSPVTIRSNSYIAAGSTITEEVPGNALAIARSRQINKEDWVIKRKK